MQHFDNFTKCFSLQVTALHYNENGGRDQARSKGGQLIYKIKFPKYKHGHHVVTKVASEATFCEEFLHQFLTSIEGILTAFP